MANRLNVSGLATSEPILRRRPDFPAELHRRATCARRNHPNARVELWPEDEHWLGLKPILRRVWDRRGQRPLARIRPRYEWLYLIAFVHPQDRRTSFWLVQRIHVVVFAQVLKAFAQEQPVSPRKRIRLVMDRAGWHLAAEVEPPEGLTLIFLPSYSLELQPVERLWSLCDESLANRTYERLANLENVLSERCCALSEQTEQIRAHTLLHRWSRLSDMR